MAAPPPDGPIEDFLGDHPRYQQLQYLSRGLFGYVVLAMDKTKGSLVCFVNNGSLLSQRYK